MSVRNRAVKTVLSKTPRVDRFNRPIPNRQQEALTDFDSRWRELQSLCAPRRSACSRFLAWLMAWWRGSQVA